MISTVLFDFFGTLVAYHAKVRDQAFHATHEYLLHNGVAIDYAVFLNHMESIFVRLEERSRTTLQEYNMHQAVEAFAASVDAPHLKGRLATEFIDHYMEEWCAGISPKPGLLEVLDELAGDYQLGVVSNTHHRGLVPEQLEALGISDYFESVVTSVDHGRPKPHESIYYAALSALGAAPNRSVFVGDSYEADFIGPRSIGMHALLISQQDHSSVPAALRVGSLREVTLAIARVQ